MGKLQDKVAVITGGASGIGAATARLFVSEGAKVVLVDLNEEKGKAFEEELKALNAEALFIKTDITSEEEVENLFKKTVETFGKVDIVFNNAGIGRVHPSHDLEYSEWRKTVNVDLDGVFLVARGAIREMLQTGCGAIVNTASMYGWVGSPGSAAYNAAKGGVINLTRSLALEYAEKNIRVNALCPGFIDTPIIPEEDKQVLAATTPLKRLGKSEEMAKAVLFMASDDSSFMTGNSLTVDGGYTAQ
ncbi:SDR family NAD(P)-dependent oxidoreductase [Priestia filamentosa]|uniref:glucose 1-dehydrogenase [NAD(P)(+)] n=1 Tax=Priestia filamentosa TaxID=1402861 RepID=A0A1X7EES3_9BACI|nr:SDR family NAD(P)-dependent oxidoreductase [Priestia filamentosa]AKO92866.1 short-chain dehydrogenase [Priestia filamentosa]MDT3762916.1 SDR family NAD(P)-dependent oxidoreductase [Priestia filamentosa]OXS69442.1 short-chain dehydrogenase [Priestia filamentosa]RJS63843.1 NAD(P)-dependent oxidoreductase [Priestia filamentosa]WCM14008.1 SDR family NAD(P)-dependent oxidoreductase [Priestia filamentosa]